MDWSTFDSTKMFAGLPTTKFVAGIDSTKMLVGLPTTKMLAGLPTTKFPAGIDSTKMFAELLDIIKTLGGLDPGTVVQQFQAEAERRTAASAELSPELACAIAAWFVCAVVFMLLVWFHLEEANRTGANLLQDNRAQLVHDFADTVAWAYAAKKLADRFLKRFLN
jgi:hypothetical protein